MEREGNYFRLKNKTKHHERNKLIMVVLCHFKTLYVYLDDVNLVRHSCVVCL